MKAVAGWSVPLLAVQIAIRFLLPFFVIFGSRYVPLANLLSKTMALTQRQVQLRVVHAFQRWGSLKRVIQPGVQVPVDEHLLPQQRHQVR